MIYTLTLNPAIDRTVLCPEINKVDVTRVSKTTREAAGKGINVSKVIHSMGATSTCTGFIGGYNGDFIFKSLSEDNIATKFVIVEGNTRENIKVFATETKEVLELNESGAQISKENMNEMFEYFDRILTSEDIIVMAGSVPSNIGNDIYKQWIERYKEIGVKTVLDTSKDLFEEGIKAGPSVIKPNLYELEMYFDTKINNQEELIEYSKKLLSFGIENVLVTMGKDGSLFISKDELYKVSIPSVKVKGTVGAGDSFVAGYSIALERKLNTVDALKYASAVSIASCLQEGSAPGKLADVEILINQIEVERLEVE